MSTQDVMTVRVRDRRGNPTQPVVVAVTIPAACPQCGGPRGQAQPLTQWDAFAQTNYETDIWTNRCGHVDMYETVLAEAGA